MQASIGATARSGRSWRSSSRVGTRFEQNREPFASDALEPITDFLDAGDRVVVRFIWRFVGHGPEAKMEITGVYTVRKGRIFAVELFFDLAEALEAAGLEE